MEIRYTDKISAEDYNFLRKSVEWPELGSKQAQTGIRNSTFIIAAIVDNKTVGVTRVVSDGGYIAIIVDVIVLPDFQGNGIGKTMMEKAMDHIKSNINEGDFVFVNVMAARDKESFYSQFGFETRPNEKVGAGMTQYIYHTT
jgi:GNAT superfamily N-acetyltransferase